MDDCPHCGSGRTVPVLDARMKGAPYGGNPYRVRCLACSRWLPSTSKETFKNHLHPHVLPNDADPEAPAEESLDPLEEWDEAERYAEVVERLEAYRDRDHPTRVATDGGESDEPDEPDEPDEADEESVEDEAVNRFACPGCEAVVEGYPDECPECEAPYNWD